jgi:hypothetical protein
VRLTPIYIVLIVQFLQIVNVDGGIVESIKHFFLHCPRYTARRQCLLSLSAQLLHTMWLSLSEDQIVETFLYGSEILDYEENQILMHSLFILQTKRFTSLTEY